MVLVIASYGRSASPILCERPARSDPRPSAPGYGATSSAVIDIAPPPTGAGIARNWPESERSWQDVFTNSCLVMRPRPCTSGEWVRHPVTGIGGVAVARGRPAIISCEVLTLAIGD